jgi:hypothetical protein
LRGWMPTLSMPLSIDQLPTPSPLSTPPHHTITGHDHTHHPPHPTRSRLACEDVAVWDDLFVCVFVFVCVGPHPFPHRADSGRVGAWPGVLRDTPARLHSDEPFSPSSGERLFFMQKRDPAPREGGEAPGPRRGGDKRGRGQHPVLLRSIRHNDSDLTHA